MSVDQMREAILEVYPNSTWRRKVDKMPDEQVIAIYMSFLNNGRFEQLERMRFPKRSGADFFGPGTDPLRPGTNPLGPGANPLGPGTYEQLTFDGLFTE